MTKDRWENADQEDRQVLNRTDVAVLVADSTEELKPCDKELLELFRKKEIPYLIAWNKCDLLDEKGRRKTSADRF